MTPNKILKYDNDVYLFKDFIFDNPSLKESYINKVIADELVIYDNASSNISLYDFFDVSIIQELINELKIVYAKWSISYNDKNDFIKKFKMINTYALYDLANSFMIMNKTTMLNIIEGRKLTKTSENSLNETLNGNIKNADTPTFKTPELITGELIENYTTSQQKNTSSRLSNQDIVDDETETLPIIESWGKFLSMVKGIEINQYFNTFKPLFFINPVGDLFE